MFKFEVAKAPHQIYGAFERLLGAEQARSFWATYRDRYIREDDIRFIKAVGFNTVRIPLHYALFMAADGAIAGEGWALLDRVMGWARTAGLYVILDLHAAPRRPDRHQSRRRAGLSADVLRATRQGAHGQAVAGDRAALRRRSGDPGLRPLERADRALSRHRDAQSPARTLLQAGNRDDTRGRSRPCRDPGGRAMELELRYVRAALRAQPRLHLSFVLGEHEARLDPGAISTSPISTTCRCSSARPAS